MVSRFLCSDKVRGDNLGQGQVARPNQISGANLEASPGAQTGTSESLTRRSTQKRGAGGLKDAVWYGFKIPSIMPDGRSSEKRISAWPQPRAARLSLSFEELRAGLSEVWGPSAKERTG